MASVCVVLFSRFKDIIRFDMDFWCTRILLGLVVALVAVAKAAVLDEDPWPFVLLYQFSALLLLLFRYVDMPLL